MCVSLTQTALTFGIEISDSLSAHALKRLHSHYLTFHLAFAMQYMHSVGTSQY